MKLYKFSLSALVSILILSSCSDFLDTVPDQSMPTETAIQSPNYFLGFLYQAYDGIEDRVTFDYEAATDNAIANREYYKSSKAARGGISFTNNPLGDTWESSYMQINSVNWFIEHMVIDTTKLIPTPVRFDLDSVVNMEIFYLSLGEAYFLRAWYQFDLLKKYGGLAEDDKVYGFPISTKYLTYSDELDLKRNTYQECVNQIAADCDTAFKYLPLAYTKSNGTVGEGLTNDAGRANGISALALKARTLLLNASPAFNKDNNTELWKSAAAAAKEAIDAIGDDDLLAFSAYFNKNNLNDAKYNNKDLFFRGPIVATDFTLEKENFPPRAYGGNGRFNPSQNLVEAFPMKDGYPINQSPTYTYDPDNQMANRDQRLNKFIASDGQSFAGITLDTKEGGQDALGSEPNATRSGYYLKKLLDPSVSLEPGKQKKTTRAVFLLTRPELYLNFAEAAVNATGSPDDATYGYTARAILAKVRKRSLGTADVYLPTISGKDDFVELLKNERRIELCFEDFRFWDQRRWSAGAEDVSYINTPAYGIYSDEPAEGRSFASPYMPLPFKEMVKTENLLNNKGW
ncbi:RagB/SusD family nutrient uptake outer membrane protein [Saccharicrinis aurantiacus]|uniref:RagB/SusD family nutrient uptake outer membrane protein n=1 Tax=Saccharicrinis aurantiacus TaxID=1849719 RepID=UPI002493BF69|nr:RagB/SusD family nutrient uptake outer membrane protein [Saccharicrinis aurantiacus]